MATPKKDTAKIAKVDTEKKANTSSIKINKSTIGFAAFVTIWVGLSMIASQYIIGFPMIWILQNNFTQPLWVCVYDALVYLMTLALVILIPPKLWDLWQKRQANSITNKKPDITNENPLQSNRTEIGLKTLPTFVDIGLAPVAYVLYLVFANLLINAMTIFPWFNSDQAQDVGFSYFITSGDRIIAMIALVFIAPVAEELIMRGWLYGKLRSKLKILPAILLVSVLFGFLHGQWNVAISTFVLSVILCGLREITGTIWSGIFLHMIVNGIAFYVLYIAGI